MLKEVLSTKKNREKVACFIGRLLGLFPKDSTFDDYKHIFEDDEDPIHHFLLSTLNSLEQFDAIIAVDENNIIWNEGFQVDTYLNVMKRKKESQKYLVAERVKAKNILRKSISIGQTIGSDLVAKVTNIDLDTLEIVTEIRKNKNWDHVFDINEIVIWHFINILNDIVVFEAESKKEEGNHAQSLLYVGNDITFERDS
jgi:hypothetical protein